jgi:hypothetical protein
MFCHVIINNQYQRTITHEFPKHIISLWLLEPKADRPDYA